MHRKYLVFSVRGASNRVEIMDALHYTQSYWHDGLQLFSYMNKLAISIYIYGKQQVFLKNNNYFFKFHLVIGNTLL
jgi:hypothetical protein